MKRYAVSGSILTLVLGVASFVTPGAAAQTPDRIALLKWYGANLITKFRVENSPVGVAFDGVDIWVTNSASNTVSKLRAHRTALFWGLTMLEPARSDWHSMAPTFG